MIIAEQFFVGDHGGKQDHFAVIHDEFLLYLECGRHYTLLSELSQSFKGIVFYAILINRLYEAETAVRALQYLWNDICVLPIFILCSMDQKIALSVPHTLRRMLTNSKVSRHEAPWDFFSSQVPFPIENENSLVFRLDQYPVLTCDVCAHTGALSVLPHKVKAVCTGQRLYDELSDALLCAFPLLQGAQSAG